MSNNKTTQIMKYIVKVKIEMEKEIQIDAESIEEAREMANADMAENLYYNSVAITGNDTWSILDIKTDDYEGVEH